jgi:drug/metabolite transporter (DMT)-like permease
VCPHRYAASQLRPRRQVAIIFTLTIVYALCFVAIMVGLTFAPPLAFAGMRALLGGLVLLGVLTARRQPVLPPTACWPWVAAIALTATTLAFGAMFLSSGRTGAGIASVLGNTQPLLVPALAAVFLSERMTRGTWIALVCGLVGVLLIATPRLAGPNGNTTGPAIAFAASLGLALSTILVKRMQPQIDVLLLTTWQLLLGSLPLLIASALAEPATPIRWAWPFVGLLLFLAIPGTAVANVVWYWLIRDDDVGRLSQFFFLIPVFGLLFAGVLLGEVIAPIALLGIGATLAGIGVVAWEAVRTVN